MPAATERLAAPLALDLRDVRSGGRWTRFQRLKNGALLIAIRCALTIADRIPFPVLEWVLRLAARAYYALDRRARLRALHVIEDQLPDIDAELLAKECFVRAGSTLAETLLLRREHFSALTLVHVSDPDRRSLEAALEGGRGAVVVSAHLGAFELVPAVVAELGLRPAVVVRESYDPRLDAHVDQHRVARGVRVVHRGKPGAGLGLLRALRDGRPLGILPDLPGRVPSLEVGFLDGRRRLAVGPARLALRTGAPLLACTLAPRQAGDPISVRYRLAVRPVLPAPTEQEMTQRVANVLGSAVRAMPAAFPWMA